MTCLEQEPDSVTRLFRAPRRLLLSEHEAQCCPGRARCPLHSFPRLICLTPASLADSSHTPHFLCLLSCPPRISPPGIGSSSQTVRFCYFISLIFCVLVRLRYEKQARCGQGHLGSLPCFPKPDMTPGQGLWGAGGSPAPTHRARVFSSSPPSTLG